MYIVYAQKNTHIIVTSAHTMRVKTLSLYRCAGRKTGSTAGRKTASTK